MPTLKEQFYEEFIGWMKNADGRPGDLTDAQNDEITELWELWKKANDLAHSLVLAHTEFNAASSCHVGIDRLMYQIEDYVWDYFNDSGELQKLINAKYGED